MSVKLCLDICFSFRLAILFYCAQAFIGNIKWVWNDNASVADRRCWIFETCSEPCVNKDMDALFDALNQNLYGQPVALKAIHRTISAHLLGDPERPLALSFHGPTGVGKNHVARLIVNSIYRLAHRSSFVHYFVASRDFAHIQDENERQKYKRWLVSAIERKAWKCAYSLFVFDEMDKMPINLIDVISSFLDTNSHEVSTIRSRRIDFRKSIFIFLSNTGERVIVNHTLNAWKRNRYRNDFELEEFEMMLTNSAFNEDGGLWHADLIRRHQISFFIPFLPLERGHLVKCVHSYVRRRNHSKYIDDDRFALRVLDELIYVPTGLALFSSSGCKRIPEKVELLIVKNGEKIKRSRSTARDEL